jgi:hypothetical protein
MGKYTDLAVLVASGVAVLLFLRVAWRGSRRGNRTDVTPVSEQWLAERRGKQD